MTRVRTSMQTALTRPWPVSIFSMLVGGILLTEAAGIAWRDAWAWGLLAALWATAMGALLAPWLRRHRTDGGQGC